MAAVYSGALSYSAAPHAYATAQASYLSAPFSPAAVTSVPFATYAAAATHPETVSISENEGQAPEGTPLSSALCQRLGVPQGTLWGLPSGQRRSEESAQAPVTQQVPNPNVTPTKPSEKPAGVQV